MSHHLDRGTLQTTSETLFADNSTGDITAAKLREHMENITDNAVIKKIYSGAPTVTDDAAGTAGNGKFETGDIWIDTSAELVYACVDQTALSAEWINISGSGNSTHPVAWTSGTGSPEGVVTADVGAMYTRTDGGTGTTLYVKESGTGNTGWAAK